MTERPLGRDTWVTVRHWDRLVASLPIAPHVMRGVVPAASPNVRRFHHRTFLDQRQRGFCFPAGTPVVMADGTERPIEQVKDGDEVLTTAGRVRAVIDTFRRLYNGPLYSVRLRGLDFMARATAEHPFAVDDDGKLEWRCAEQLSVGDRVYVPFADPPRVNDVGMAWARLAGLYLAEGCVEQRVVRWYYSHEETLLAEETAALIGDLFSVTAKVKLGQPHPTVCMVRCDSRALADKFRATFPGDCRTKRVPPEFFSAERHVRLALVRGWLDGDGHARVRRNSMEVVGVSSSEGLRRDMARLLISCGVRPTMTLRKKAAHQRVAAGSVNLYGADAVSLFPEYEGRIDPDAKRLGVVRRTGRDDGGFYYPIKSIDRIEVVGLPVCNLEVSGDETYIAGGMGVHNCVGFNTCATVMSLLRIPPGATAESQPLPAVRLSPLYVYDISWVEAAAEGINLGRNDGSIASCAMKGCHIHGVVLATDYPCGPQDIDNHRNGTVPPSSVEAVGREHLVEEFAIADSWDHGLELLGAGFPISLASDIPSGMMQTDAQGRFRMRGGIVGGHDYQFIDYDKASDTAWIGQSWKGWGEHTTDPSYAEMFGVTMIGTCSLADLASYFTPRLMSSGASEICVANRVKGWGPPIIHYDL